MKKIFLIVGIMLGINGFSSENIDNNAKMKQSVIANPGAPITDTISPYADIFVTSEVSANVYINKFEKPKSDFEKNKVNAKHIWHIVHSANPKEYARIIRLSRERNAGWLMITDDVMPNPYDREPSRFMEMVNMINK